LTPNVLAVRSDSAGDVLLAGPAIRALAAGSRRLTLLCGPAGRAAAELLPGVDEVTCHEVPWIAPQPQSVDREALSGVVDEIERRRFDEAVIFTSFHQSALPMALLLRLARIPRVSAISDDYPGSLLDVRHRTGADLHEVDRNLSLAEAAGFPLAAGDDRRLRVLRGVAMPAALDGWSPYIVVHPGTSVPARAWAPARHAELVRLLAERGRKVVVTGSTEERTLTRAVAGPPRSGVLDLGGAVDLAQLAEVLAGAEAVVVGNTGPAHLAGAVGTPVVSLFAPTVPPARWRPWMVPCELLVREQAPCADTRVTVCPFPGHPCLDSITPDEVLAAVERLAPIGSAAGASVPL
jgi:ADP-heptose:LPS heptosyltransferase